jgi:hypothetical protein
MKHVTPFLSSASCLVQKVREIFFPITKKCSYTFETKRDGIFSHISRNCGRPLSFFFFFLPFPFHLTGLSGTFYGRLGFFFLCGAAGLRGTFPGYLRPPSLLSFFWTTQHEYHNTQHPWEAIRPGI